MDKLTLPVAYDLEEQAIRPASSWWRLPRPSAPLCRMQDSTPWYMPTGTFIRKWTRRPLTDMGVDYWYAWYPYGAGSGVRSIPSAARPASRISGSTALPAWVQGALASGKTDINVLYMPEYLPFLRLCWKRRLLPLRRGSAGAAAPMPAVILLCTKQTASGEVSKVGTYDGNVHSRTDQSYLPGEGYYVTMEISIPSTALYYKSYTSQTVYPETARYEVRVSAQEGGSASGGGSFLVGKNRHSESGGG